MNPQKKSFFEYPTASGVFIVAYHIGLLIGLPIYFYYRTPGLGLVLTSIVLLFLTEIGIGAAYHRFYSHCAYKMKKPVEAVLLFLATVAFQGSALRWSFEHRLHHAHTDTDSDPYSIKKGFWYAHCLWLFDPVKDIDKRQVADLMKNRLVTLQNKFYATASVGSNIAIWLLAGWWFNDFLGAFVLTWWTRLLVSHHLTWFVNSLCHCWGEQTYSKELSAVDNYILAFLTVGEGYHNYHHTFASDYRNGVRWYHFDPVKWTIFTLSKLGLASNLKRYSPHAIRRRLLLEDKRLLLEKVKGLGPEFVQQFERRVLELSETIQAKIDRMRVLAEDIKSADGGSAGPALEKARSEMRALRKALRDDWRHWGRLADNILEPGLVPA